MKKAYIFAILVLAATAIASETNRVENKPKLSEVMKSVHAQLKSKHHKRISTCEAIKCGKKGDKCDDSTMCQTTTECLDGICRQSNIGDKCNSLSPCYSDGQYCATNGTCIKIPVAGDKCDTTCVDSSLYCNSVDKVCKKYPEKVGDDCSAAGYCDMTKGVYCSDDTKKCVALPKEGEECVKVGTIYSIYYCASGLVCNKNDTKCMSPLKLGDDCDYYHSYCGNGLICSKSDKCVSKTPGEGDYCEEDEADCPDGFSCTDDKCVDNKGVCSHYSDCKHLLFYY